jgi:hypothetical protein
VRLVGRRVIVIEVKVGKKKKLGDLKKQGKNKKQNKRSALKSLTMVPW